MRIKALFSNLALLIVLSLLNWSCKDKQTSDKEVLVPEINQTKDEESTTKANQKTILCFGNSLTAGYGLKNEDDGWTFLLQKRLDSLNHEYTVVNAGLSGETTAEGVQRIEWVLNQAFDIFILELGANDMLRGLNVDETKNNLDKILKIVKDKNEDTKIILAGMMSPPNMGEAYEKAFNKTFPELAIKYNAELIPFFLENVALNPDLNLPDGKHPNPKGQKIVLETVWKQLKKVL